MTRHFHISTFGELSNTLLYAILALRGEVFVVEQESAYLDPDGIDPQCLHVCLMEGEKLIGYARIVPPSIKFEEASIGRIVLAPTHRGSGLGRVLVQRSMDELAKQFGQNSIRIEAQHHLRNFYESLGFTIVSDIYDWGGIPHVKMLLNKKVNA